MVAPADHVDNCPISLLNSHASMPRMTALFSRPLEEDEILAELDGTVIEELEDEA
jgi:hypothetical protein